MKIYSDNQKGFQFLSVSQAEDGRAVKRFRKELLKPGPYVKVHVVGYTDNNEVEIDENEMPVDAEMIKLMESNFRLFQERGIKVPITNMHDTTGNPDNSRGYATDIFQEYDDKNDQQSLQMHCDLIGKDAIDAAPRCDVSIHAEKDHWDGLGNHYTWAITHIALCTNPVVPGLGDFIPLSLSMSLSQNQKEDSPQERANNKDTDIKQEIQNMDLTNEQIEAIKSVLGIEGDLTPENLLTAIEAKKADKPAEAEAEVDKTDETVTEPAAPVVETAEAITASLTKVDPISIKLIAENRKLKMDALIAAGKLTPVARKELEKVFSTDESISLSLSNNSLDESTTYFDGVFAALSINDPVALKEQSGPQTMSLSNPITPQESSLVLMAKERKEAANKRRNS